MVPLKYLSKFFRTLEMPLVNRELYLILTWSGTCAIISTNDANENATFAINDTKLYVPVVFLSTQDNAKLLQQLKSGFKRAINWNKYLSKRELLAQIPNLNHVMSDGKNFFDQPIKDNKVAYENIRKIATGQGDDYRTGCLLGYPYVNDTYKMIAVDLNKQQVSDADPINFTANLD